MRDAPQVNRGCFFQQTVLPSLQKRLDELPTRNWRWWPRQAPAYICKGGEAPRQDTEAHPGALCLQVYPTQHRHAQHGGLHWSAQHFISDVQEEEAAIAPPQQQPQQTHVAPSEGDLGAAKDGTRTA